MKFILGKKMEMTRIFDKKGIAVPVTLIEAGPCVVTKVKSFNQKDKYDAVQIGFGERKKINKPLEGQLKEFKQKFLVLKEFRTKTDGFAKGMELKVDIFKEVKKVNVSGLSKGRGFQGGVKRYGFSGGRASHGDRHVLRQIGSVGASFPEKVWKGKRMPGHMGPRRFTIKNLEIIKIVPEENLLAVKGAVPGHKGTILEIKEAL